jgi:sugar O-acyltransferase (sialic acid O-acetyltransferase NeuD family)
MRVVIFGLEQLSTLAWYCLTHDSPHKVVAFTADGAYVNRQELMGLPVVAFEEVEARFPPESCAMLLPIGARAANGLRSDKYEQARRKGYACPTYVSSRALTWPDLDIGDNSLVYEGAVIQPFCRIGSDVIIRHGVSVSHHGRIGDHCFLANHAVLGGGVTLEDRCFVGLNATIRDGVTIAKGCMIAAGALVTRDTIENGVYAGSPARHRRIPADRFFD